MAWGRKQVSCNKQVICSVNGCSRGWMNYYELKEKRKPITEIKLSNNLSVADEGGTCLSWVFFGINGKKSLWFSYASSSLICSGSKCLECHRDANGTKMQSLLPGYVYTLPDLRWLITILSLYVPSLKGQLIDCLHPTHTHSASEQYSCDAFLTYKFVSYRRVR